MSKNNSNEAPQTSIKDADLSSQFDSRLIARESDNNVDYSSNLSYNVLTEAEKRRLASESKARSRSTQEKEYLANERSNILRAARSRSGFSPELDEHVSVFSQEKVEPTQTGNSDFHENIPYDSVFPDKGDTVGKPVESQLDDVSSNVSTYIFSNSPVEKGTSTFVLPLPAEKDLSSRRTRLSKKRELWLQQQQLATEQSSSTPSVDSLLSPTQQSQVELFQVSDLETSNSDKNLTTYNSPANQDSLAPGNLEIIDRRNDKFPDMETTERCGKIIGDDVHTEQTIQNNNNWIGKLKHFENPADFQDSYRDFVEIDDTSSSPSPIRRAKSEHDILSTNDEKRASKRRKVLKTKSGQIVRRNLADIFNIENKSQVTVADESSWLEGLVKAEVQNQEQRQNKETVRSTTSERISDHHNQEMHFDPRTNTLPRSETIDEESIRIDDRKEWLGRLVELEISGRQDSLKKFNKQKSMQMSSNSSIGSERRRSLPAGRLVEEYLHRQAVEIAPAYEQPGDFARQSQPKNAAFDQRNVSTASPHKVLTSSLSSGNSGSVPYDKPSHKQGHNTELYRHASTPNDQAVYSTSGIVKNSVFMTGNALNEDRSKPQAAKTTSIGPQTKPNSTSSLPNAHTELVMKSPQALPTKGIGEKRNNKTQPQLLHQQRSLDSSLVHTSREDQDTFAPYGFNRASSPRVESRSMTEIDEEAPLPKVGIPSIKDKIAAFRNAETTSSPDLFQKSTSHQRQNSPLRSSKSLDSKSVETVKNLEVVQRENSPVHNESKAGKFHIHQNNTVVQRALHLSSGDSFEKKERLVSQRQEEETLENTAESHGQNLSDQPSSNLNLARMGKTFWESISVSANSNDGPTKKVKKNRPISSGSESSIKGKSNETKGAELTLAHDIGAAILGYDEKPSSSEMSEVTSPELSLPTTDSESDPEDIDYLKLVQDNRIKQEIEEQKVREREIRRINRAKQKTRQSDGIRTREFIDFDEISKQNKQVGSTLPKSSIDTGIAQNEKRQLAKTPGQQRENRVPKQKIPEQQDIRAQTPTKTRVDTSDSRSPTGPSKSILLQREEEEERRRQMEFEEEKRQRLEEVKRREEKEKEKEKQVELERKRKEEEEAERQRKIKEKKLEGKRKTHSLRALFEKVC